MMTSSNGNIFRVIGPLWGESTCPLTKASDAELWCFLWFGPEQTVEQTIETPEIEMPSRSLWSHCNAQGCVHCGSSFSPRSSASTLLSKYPSYQTSCITQYYICSGKIRKNKTALKCRNWWRAKLNGCVCSTQETTHTYIQSSRYGALRG